MHNPAHPGEVLLDLYLKPIGVSIRARHGGRDLGQQAGAQHDLWEAMQKAPPKVKVLSAA